MIKHFLVTFLALLAIILFVILKKPPTNTKLPLGQNVTVAVGSKPRTLDPRYATDATSMRMVDLIFSSLVRISREGKVLPSLASRWSYHNKTYTFFIPHHWQFSNGRKLTKKDILFSFKQYQSPHCPFASSFKIIKSVKVTTHPKQKNFIVKVQLKTDSAKFLSADLPVLKILPEAETLALKVALPPIGIGPFKLKTQGNTSIVLIANTYAPTPPHIHQVTFEIIRDGFTRFQKILSGAIDIAQSELSPQKVKWFLNNSKHSFQVIRSPGLSINYLLLNFKDPCLKKKQFRKALTLSINRSQIIKYKLHNMAYRASSLLSKGNRFLNTQIKHRPFDLKKARQILQTLSVCKNHPLSLKSSLSKETINYAHIIAHEWRHLGLNIQLENYEWGTFYQDINTGQFQIALLRWVGISDPDIYRIAFHSKEHPPKGRNRSFYTNPTLDHLLQKGLTTMNFQKRKQIYDKVQQISFDDINFIPLWHNEQITIVKNTIKGYTPSFKGDFYYLTKIKKSPK